MNFITYGCLHTFQKKGIAKFRALAKLHCMDISLNRDNVPLHTIIYCYRKIIPSRRKERLLLDGLKGTVFVVN